MRLQQFYRCERRKKRKKIWINLPFPHLISVPLFPPGSFTRFYLFSVGQSSDSIYRYEESKARNRNIDVSWQALTILFWNISLSFFFLLRQTINKRFRGCDVRVCVSLLMLLLRRKRVTINLVELWYIQFDYDGQMMDLNNVTGIMEVFFSCIVVLFSIRSFFFLNELMPFVCMRYIHTKRTHAYAYISISLNHIVSVTLNNQIFGVPLFILLIILSLNAIKLIDISLLIAIRFTELRISVW